MSAATVLARAHLASTRNHLTMQLGGRAARNAVLIIGSVLLGGYNALVYVGSASLLSGITENAEMSRLVLPVLPLVLTAPAFGIALVMTMLLPVESPLALQARLIGASRWYCAASEFVPIAMFVALSSLVSLAGSFVFVAGLAAAPVAAFAALAGMAVLAGMLCLIIVLLVDRALSIFSVPPRERRVWGAVVAAACLAAFAADLFRWAASQGRPAGFQTTEALARLWGDGLPDTWAAVLIVFAGCLLLAGTGILLSFGDPAGGYLRTGRVLVRVPPFRSLIAQSIAVEIAYMIRDSTSRVSLIAMLALDAALAAAARSGTLDHGVILLLLVFISATGGELVIGRTRAINWTLRSIGIGDRTIFWLRVGVISAVLTIIFTIAMIVSGLIDKPVGLVAEAYSLFAAVLAIAVLAGTVLPFDPTASLGMFATSALSLVMELTAIITVTTVLKLTGPALIAADITITVLALIGASVAFGRSRRNGP